MAGVFGIISVGISIALGLMLIYTKISQNSLELEQAKLILERDSIQRELSKLQTILVALPQADSLKKR